MWNPLKKLITNLISAPEPTPVPIVEPVAKVQPKQKKAKQQPTAEKTLVEKPAITKKEQSPSVESKGSMIKRLKQPKSNS